MPEAYTELPAASPDGRARAAALAMLAGRTSTPTTSVTYVSTGRVLIVGEVERARAVAARLGEPLQCTVGGAVRGLRGHLGAFHAHLEGDSDDAPLREFDLVVDLGEPPSIPFAVPPPGYFRAGAPEALDEALEQLPSMCGEYEKPRYFNYSPDICARGASGILGCTRCTEVCPTGAISVAGDKVAVDPFLCQGAGPCVSVCPSGAMGYQYPPLADVLSGLAVVLGTYREANGRGPVLLLHDRQAGAQWVASNAGSLPEFVIPLELEEVASLGMDGWLCALAYGACAVMILLPADLPASVRIGLAEQVDLTHALLAGMGIAADRLVLFADAAINPALFAGLPREPAASPARFASLGEKRTMIRMAVDHLAGANAPPRANWPMPGGSPFGEVVVDIDACTLCLACASVCPMRALTDGQDIPELNFTEWNCVQCGVCASACPEHAISLRPRFLFDAQARLRTRSLKREEPFCCVSCGKPFATQSLMDRITSRLRDHSMFQDPRAVRRLQMCEDCRVRDMYLADSGSE